VLLGLVVSIASAFASGAWTGKEYAEGRAAQAAQLIADTREQAMRGAAEAIAKNKPVHQHIKQVLEREIRTVPDYSRCVHSPDGLRSVNAALENKPIGDSVVPDADTSDR